MFCGHCGAEIPQDVPYCRGCGAPRPDRDRAHAPGGPESEIYLLLAGANLARMRRRYHEAASKCVEVLRRQPKNGTAHSLLGDIYRDQGLDRDAIEWYKLALELDPGARSDRAKLDRLIDRVYAGAEAGPSPTKGPLRRLADRLCATLGCAGLTRPVRITMAVTIGLLLVLFIALLAYRASLTPSVGASEAPETPAPSAAAPPRPAPAPPQEPGTPIAPGPALPAPGPPHTGSRTTGLAARERRLLEGLRASSIKGERPRAIDGAIIDPRNQGAIVDFRAPELATPTDTKRNLILIALGLAQAARRADPALSVVTARGALPIPQRRGKKVLEYVFVGEINVQHVPDPGTPPLTPDRALGLFTDVWWHPLFRDLVP